MYVDNIACLHRYHTESCNVAALWCMQCKLMHIWTVNW